MNYYISVRTGRIPKPGAPDDLWGQQVQIVRACRTYVWCVVLGISPTGTKFLKQYYLFFLFFFF